jgi:hypothetical protein
MNPFSRNIFWLCAGAFTVGGLAVALFMNSGLQPGRGVVYLLLGLAFMYFRYRAVRNVCAGLIVCFHEEWLRKHVVPGNRFRRVDKNNILQDEFVISRAERPARELWN